ncbi:helix-turn-helix transcriptional regulator [Streptomyces lacrimifluminis]|uniref:Transcriptional regulator n=2 Tax=Streptomyces lacrimifluminis TaxID=1500077 RepID=A0A917L7P8_9ACTN|nr:transcriptional regulator [Streptomyces lacrimifluminis]
MLTGVSVDYYGRLEQGREVDPSPRVLDSLGEVLRLDHDGRQHLYRLAGISPRPEAAPVEEADVSLLELLHSWPDSPALVLGRAYDVLASNRLAEALFLGFPFSGNLTRSLFLDPGARTFYPDWHAVAESTVAGVRLADGLTPGSRRFRAIVDELRVKSPEFVTMWEQNNARGKRLQPKRFAHPEVGLLELRVHVFGVKGAPGQELVVHHAVPGSTSAQSLSLLGSLTATWQSGQAPRG